MVQTWQIQDWTSKISRNQKASSHMKPNNKKMVVSVTRTASFKDQRHGGVCITTAELGNNNSAKFVVIFGACRSLNQPFIKMQTFENPWNKTVSGRCWLCGTWRGFPTWQFDHWKARPKDLTKQSRGGKHSEHSKSGGGGGSSSSSSSSPSLSSFHPKRYLEPGQEIWIWRYWLSEGDRTPMAKGLQ